MVAEPKPRPPEVLVNETTGEVVDEDILDEALIATLAEGQAREAKEHKQNGRIEMELQRRGDATGAKVIYGDGWEYQISITRESDWANMPPVLEYFTPEEKIEAYKPEHTIIVPAEPEYVVAEVPEHDEVIQAKWAPIATVEKLARRHGNRAVASVSKFPAKVSGKLVSTK